MNITVHIDEERLKQKKEKPSAKSRRALHRKTLFFPKLKHLIEFSNTIFKIHENHNVFQLRIVKNSYKKKQQKTDWIWNVKF